MDRLRNTAENSEVNEATNGKIFYAAYAESNIKKAKKATETTP
jgi:hypothetical protein